VEIRNNGISTTHLPDFSIKKWLIPSACKIHQARSNFANATNLSASFTIDSGFYRELPTGTSFKSYPAQQDLCCWIGGHLTEP
jgi:hypothetical protein